MKLCIQFSSARNQMSWPIKTRLKNFGASVTCTLIFLLPLSAQQRTQTSDPALNAAESLVQQGRLEEARAATLAALESNPKSVEGYNLLGIIAINQQDFAG